MGFLSDAAFGTAGFLFNYAIDPIQTGVLSGGWNLISTEKFNLDDLHQDSEKLLDTLDSEDYKTLLMGYKMFAGPVFEEFCFRGLIHEFIKKQLKPLPVSDSLKKITAIALSSIAFGAAHYSPFQNAMTNFVLIGQCTVHGLVNGFLKESTQSLVAPSTAHILWNSLMGSGSR